MARLDTVRPCICKIDMKPSIRRAYIAGRVTGAYYPRIYAEFASAKQFLLSQGYDEVINPCELVVPGTSWIDAMIILLPYLATCNYLVLLPGYETSNGAMTEYYFARGMEKDGKLNAIIHLAYKKTVEKTQTLKEAI